MTAIDINSAKLWISLLFSPEVPKKKEKLELKIIGGSILALAGSAAFFSLRGAPILPLACVLTGFAALGISSFKKPSDYSPISIAKNIKSSVEKIKKQTAMRLITTSLVSVAIAVPIFYLLKNLSATPYDNFILSKADPNRIMATEIDNFQSISGLKQINGIAISDIERRARPGVLAHSGFLGASENLKDILQKDWKTVSALGTTHIEIANHLEAIFEKAWPINDHGYGPLIYDVAKLQNNTIGNGSRFQLLNAIRFDTCGYQENLFAKSAVDWFYDCFKKYGFHFKEDWRSNAYILPSDLWLKNIATGESMNIAYGTIDYIRKYGFYQGGEGTNGYRNDPIRLVSILTGNSYRSIANTIGQ
ncbi:MAG: hypothetical protein Q8K75_08430 [Chlamydiales bacterium]|nr:hypothetical protein [Chlamydiales bacterium]